jgi:hypothetical protein
VRWFFVYSFPSCFFCLFFPFLSCLGHSDAAADAALADVAPGGAHITLVLVIRQLPERHPDKRQHKNTRQLQEY